MRTHTSLNRVRSWGTSRTTHLLQKDSPITSPSSRIYPPIRHHFSQLSLLPPTAQAKLNLSQPTDPAEQEADQVADQVLRMPQVESLEKEEEESEKQLQRQAETGSRADVTPQLQQRINHLQQGGGQPLSVTERSFFEPRFGQDFSQVRLHRDQAAGETAKAVNARAFTIGRNVVFGAGQYQPQSVEGRRLLAHELTHVVQQNTSGHPPATLQLEPEKAGERTGTIQVRWTDDDVDFYHRVIEAINRSRNFRGIKKASLWQPFHDPIFHIFSQLNRRTPSLEKGKGIDLRVSAWFDPTVFHGQLTSASVRLEQSARLAETKIKGVLTPRVQFTDRKPAEFGPAEIVDLSFTSDPAITADRVGGLQWVKISGNGNLTSDNNGTGVFTTGASGNVELELRIASGFSSGQVVSTHHIKVLHIEQMVSRDPNQPERLTIVREGLTPELLAEHLYGTKSKATAIWAVWDEKKQGKPWTVTTQIPVGMWIGVEYRYLLPKWQTLYDESIDITKRQDWGAKPPIIGDPKRSYEPYTGALENILDTIVVHHAGNKGYKTMKEVQNLHLQEREAADINYHYGISLNGTVYEGRPINVKGAHVPKANTGKIGIVLLADLDPGPTFDFSEDDLSPQMEASLLRLIHFLKGKYPMITHLGGHQEFTADRSCPGSKAMSKMSSWRSQTNLLK